MKQIIRTQLLILGALVGAITLTLTACGGGGSSAGAGGGGGTMVAGTINNGIASLTTGGAGSMLAALGQTVVPRVEAATEYDVTLICSGGFSATQTTVNHKFTFVDPGDGSLSGDCSVSVGGNPVPGAVLTVTAGGEYEIEINDNAGAFTVVKVEQDGGGSGNAVVEVEVEDGASSDQASNDQDGDGNSSDDQASNDQNDDSNDDGKSSDDQASSDS